MAGAVQQPGATIAQQSGLLELNAGLGDPGLKARFADLGSSAFVGSPSDFGKFVVEETDKWAKVVKFAGIKPE